METNPKNSRSFRFRLSTLLVVVALVGLILAAVVREVQHRDELRHERDRAQVNLDKARAAVDQLYTVVAERSAAEGPQNAELQREFLEQSLNFYRQLESKASTPEEKASFLDRMKPIQRELEITEPGDEGTS
jgi:hypothetical protein